MTWKEAIKFCEEHDCGECFVKEDKRTEYEKKILQYPCCWNLVDKEEEQECPCEFESDYACANCTETLGEE